MLSFSNRSLKRYNSMREKVAIVANADSFWTQRFIENVSLELAQKIVLISASNKNYKEYYNNAGIKVITTKTNGHHPAFHKLEAIITSINTLRAIKKENPDIVHVHYAYPYILKILPYLSNDIKTIITYWGSDLLRVDDKKLMSFKKAVMKADKLVTMTSDLKTELIRIYGDSVSKKISVIDMGISAFDSIDEKREDIPGAKKRFVGEDNCKKSVVTIGYNAGKGQQHLKVLSALSKMPQPQKDNLILLLPLTYQREDTDYLDEIMKSVASTQIDAICLANFMDNEQIADLCLCTDIFINAQITDALSSSMLEHIYANSIVINGDWLKYGFLNEMGIDCLTFSRFSDLPDLLRRIIEHELVLKDSRDNAAKLKQHCSWDASRDKWNMLYNSLH